MESRSVYLGIAIRMRGNQAGALSRAYIHSRITEGLWYAVAETERLFNAKLAHASMLASLYGNSNTDVNEGSDHIHDLYVKALQTIPYIQVNTPSSADSNAALVEEWKRVNAEEARKREAAEGRAGGAQDGKAADDV